MMEKTLAVVRDDLSRLSNWNTTGWKQSRARRTTVSSGYGRTARRGRRALDGVLVFNFTTKAAKPPKRVATRATVETAQRTVSLDGGLN